MWRSAHLILDLYPTNVCLQVCASNGSSALLAAKRSAGVAPEVNLLYTPGFETRLDATWSPKTGVPAAPREGLMSFKKDLIEMLHKF